MLEIRCTHPNCNQFIVESGGEVKRECPKCKRKIHVVVTTKGIIDLNTLNTVTLKIDLNKRTP